MKVAEDLIKIKSKRELDKVNVKETIGNSMDALALLTTAHSVQEDLRRDLITKNLIHEQSTCKAYMSSYQPSASENEAAALKCIVF